MSQNSNGPRVRPVPATLHVRAPFELTEHFSWQPAQPLWQTGSHIFVVSTVQPCTGVRHATSTPVSMGAVLSTGTSIGASTGGFTTGLSTPPSTAGPFTHLLSGLQWYPLGQSSGAT